jgi:hypothetical protein
LPNYTGKNGVFMKLEILLIPLGDNWIRIDVFTYNDGFEAHASSADRQVMVIERGNDKFEVVMNALRRVVDDQ